MINNDNDDKSNAECLNKCFIIMLVHRTLSCFIRIFLHSSSQTVSNLRFKMLFDCRSAEVVELLLSLLIVQKWDAFYSRKQLLTIGMSFTYIANSQ